MTEKNQDDWLKPKEHYTKSKVYRCRSRKERQVENLLKDWYGNKAALEIEAHQGNPVTMGDIMDDLLGEWDKGETVTLRAVIEKWQDVVGPAYKAYTRPALLEAGVLSIEVFSAPLLVNLRMLEGEILSKVKEIVGNEVIKIRLIPGGRSSRRT
jgi:predicted nucleic acid-binding Zn ribbon protein